MADRRFLNSCIVPGVTNILGYKLKPFCIQHRLWLEAIDTVFFKPDAEIKIGDLITALKICSHQTLGKPTWHDRWVGFRLATSKDLQIRAAKAFVMYIDTSDCWPKFYERKSTASGDSGVPWQLSVVCNLVKNGIGYEEALLMPESKAIWLSTIFGIYAGAKLDILTTDDEAMLDDLAKLNSELTANGK